MTADSFFPFATCTQPVFAGGTQIFLCPDPTGTFPSWYLFDFLGNCSSNYFFLSTCIVQISSHDWCWRRLDENDHWSHFTPSLSYTLHWTSCLSFIKFAVLQWCRLIFVCGYSFLTNPCTQLKVFLDSDINDCSGKLVFVNYGVTLGFIINKY